MKIAVFKTEAGKRAFAKLEQSYKAINSKDGARQFAIDWQAWASEQNLSYGELAERSNDD